MSVHFDTGLPFSYCVEVRPLTFSVAMWIFALDRGFLFGRAGGCPAVVIFWLFWFLAGVPWSADAVLSSVVWVVPGGGGLRVPILFWVCEGLADMPDVVDATPPTIALWLSSGGSPVARWTPPLASGSLKP